MTIQIIQRAKFALLYSIRETVGHYTSQSGHDQSEVIKERAESPVLANAIVEINGLRLTSAIPTSAAEAARINEELEGLEARFKNLSDLASPCWPGDMQQ